MSATPDGTITARDICSQAVVERALQDGSVSSLKIASHIQSDTWDGSTVIAGDASQGWRIERDTGNASFNNVFIRGDIVSGNWNGAFPADLSDGEDTSADQGFYLDSSEGSAQFEGDVSIEGDVMLGGIMTLAPGGRIRTAKTGNRVELAETRLDRIEFYNTRDDDTPSFNPGFIRPRRGDERDAVIIRSPSVTPGGYVELQVWGSGSQETTQRGQIEIVKGEDVDVVQLRSGHGNVISPGLSFSGGGATSGFWWDSVNTDIVLSLNGVNRTTFNQDWDMAETSGTLQATGTDPTMGSGSTSTVKWCRAGNVIHAWYTFIFGTSGAANGSGNYYVWPEDDGLPAVESSWGTAATDRATVGWFEAEDATGGNAGHHNGSVRYEPDVSPARMVFFSHGVATYSDTVPFSWTNNDRIFIKLEYPTDP